MAQSVVVNGVTYVIPDVGDEDWGQQVTDFLVAVLAAISVTGLTERASDPTGGEAKQFYIKMPENIPKYFDGTTAYGVALIP